MRYPFRGDEPCTQIDPSFYYPEQVNIWRTHEGTAVLKICSTCHVLNECAEWAIRHELYGIWGGLTPPERERIRKQRGIRLIEPNYMPETRVMNRAS